MPILLTAIEINETPMSNAWTILKALIGPIAYSVTHAALDEFVDELDDKYDPYCFPIPPFYSEMVSSWR